MISRLNFRLAQSTTSREARFKEPKYQQEYVKAEFSDLKIQDAYLRYQAAPIKNRQLYARELDTMRYNFFLRWREKNEDKVEASGSFPELDGDLLA